MSRICKLEGCVGFECDEAHRYQGLKFECKYNEAVLPELYEEVRYPGTIEMLFFSKKWQQVKPVFQKILRKKKGASAKEILKWLEEVGLKKSNRLLRFMQGEAVQFGWTIVESENKFKLLPVGWDGKKIPEGMVDYETYCNNRTTYKEGIKIAPTILQFHNGEITKEEPVSEDQTGSDKKSKTKKKRTRKTKERKPALERRQVKSCKRIAFIFPAHKNASLLKKAMLTWYEYVNAESGHQVSLHILAQGFSKEDEKEINELMPIDADINVWFISEYGKPISQTTIRQDAYAYACANVEKQYGALPDYVVMTDDDFEFKQGSGYAYDEAVEYMDERPAIGLIQCSGYLGGYIDQGGYLTRWGSHMWMDKGIVARVIPEGIFRAIDFGKLGGLFETYIYVHYMLLGYSVATKKNVPTVHRSYRHHAKSSKRKQELSKKELKVHMHNKKFIDTAVEMFNKILGAGTYSVRQYAPALQMGFNPPGIGFFQAHYMAAVMRHDYCEYTKDNGKLSRGLTKNWRKIVSDCDDTLEKILMPEG